MISSLIDYPLLDVEREWEKLQAALSNLQRKGLIKVDRLEKGTLSELQRQLRRFLITMWFILLVMVDSMKMNRMGL